MIYLLNAMALAFAAIFWSKHGVLNLLATIVLLALAVVNAALAGHFLVPLLVR
jgi:hypothetical protein